MVDIHSHILPSLDDGSRSLEESLRMARQAVSTGIRHMAATSHGIFTITRWKTIGQSSGKRRKRLQLNRFH